MRKDPTDEEGLQAALTLFKQGIPIFTVLADENRQKIIEVLARCERLNVSQLDQMMNLSRPAISHHLKALKMAGILGSEKSGTENYYFLTIQEAVNLMKALTAAIEDSCILK